MAPNAGSQAIFFASPTGAAELDGVSLSPSLGAPDELNRRRSLPIACSFFASQPGDSLSAPHSGNNVWMSPSGIPRRYPTEDQCAAILVAADRTCCVCRVGGKAVQLHHIDEDRSNANPDNFAVLCLDCHNETQVSGGFGRQLNAAQVRRYRDEWNLAVRDRLSAAATKTSKGEAVLGAPLLRADDVIDRVLTEAERSPKIGLRLMHAELEQEVRRLLAGSGWGQGRHDWSVRSGIDLLYELGVVSQSVFASLDVLESIRRHLDSGDALDRENVLVALDVGIMTFRALAAIPRERHYVIDAHMPVFSDAYHIDSIPDVYAVRIRSAGPPPRAPRDAVFLTRETDIVVGSEVTWLWGTEVLGPAWYLDLESGRYLQANSIAFCGRPIDTVA